MSEERDNVHNASKEMLVLIRECPGLLTTIPRDRAAGLVLRVMALDVKVGGEILIIALKTLGEEFLKDMKKEADVMGIEFIVVNKTDDDEKPNENPDVTC